MSRVGAYRPFGLGHADLYDVKGQVNFPPPGPALFSTLGFSGGEINVLVPGFWVLFSSGTILLSWQCDEPCGPICPWPNWP